MRNAESVNLDRTALIDGVAPVQADHRHPHLIILSGSNGGRRHKLQRGITTIGRSPRTDVSLSDDRVSRVHCVIEWMGDTITIEDKGSTNGTFVEGRRLAANVPTPVGLGQQITLGGSVKLSFAGPHGGGGGHNKKQATVIVG